MWRGWEEIFRTEFMLLVFAIQHFLLVFCA